MPPPSRWDNHEHLFPLVKGPPPVLPEAAKTYLRAWWNPTWAGNCHAASLEVVRWLRTEHGIPARVARGGHPEIGVHSWAILGEDPWDPRATIVDPTLLEYRNRKQPGQDLGVWIGEAHPKGHTPHGGMKTIWAVGRPPLPTGPLVELTPSFTLSRAAKSFLATLGPLDRDGWLLLASACPPLGWTSGEVYAAMDDTEGLSALVPIDRLGMLTDRNPGGLYR